MGFVTKINLFVFFQKNYCILGKLVVSYANVQTIFYGCTLSGIRTRLIIKIQREVNDLPNIKSAKKRVLVTETKTLRNKVYKTQLKNLIKKFDAAVAEGNKDNAVAAFKAVTKKVDQVAARNIIHKNAAAHKKSQFAKKLASM